MLGNYKVLCLGLLRKWYIGRQLTHIWAKEIYNSTEYIDNDQRKGFRLGVAQVHN